ncbi:MAG: hypothetical protein A3G23_03090 [Bacteroidetes bacterium RIFCSPLOWO2_12_FULL_37_12]|nr:MAG: hypothetical protein A3G23_03090 [Bacteroidetes bacterium RIFCSPLOWO2_12_FULL_37_12]
MLYLLLLIIYSSSVFAQGDTSIAREAIYNRPFIGGNTGNMASGGYAEGNTNYFATDGVSEGFSMELRRFNLFLYSPVTSHIKFLSELEFEHGTEEINIETAMIDFRIFPDFSFRGGILLTPVGDFNINHDSPKWDMINRPLAATDIVPSTLSEVGFGIFGNLFPWNARITYYLYLLNGLGENVIHNEEGKTLLRAGKSGEMLGEDNNGVPMGNARISINFPLLGELGISWYGGAYNTFKKDGLDIDKKRNLHLGSLYYQREFFQRVTLNGEVSRVWIDVPAEAGENYGNRQWGYFLDMIFAVKKGKMGRLENARLNIFMRSEFVDFNEGKFILSREHKFDELYALSGGISFFPIPGTVLRMNYRWHWEYDLPGNLSRTGGFQVGLASYF